MVSKPSILYACFPSSRPANGSVHVEVVASHVAPAKAAGHAKMGGTVRIQQEVRALKDPRTYDWSQIANFSRGWLEYLVTYENDGSFLPSLLESWDISEDGLTYTFHLRDGVMFHDGTSFTAEDAVFSLDRARAEGSTNAQPGLFAGIASVEAADDTTLVVTLSAPNGSFLFNMAWGDAVMVAPESADANATNPVGTGPFRFSEWVQGDRVELVRNDAYWGEPVALEAATFRFISDPNAAFAAMMAGDVDAFPVYPSPETLAQFDADPRFNVIVGSTEGETILSTNNQADYLSDVRVRQAIAHAINRQDIIDGAMFGYGTPIGTHFAPHNPDYVDLTGLSAHDPDRARELLAEAGAEGITLRLMLPPPSYARRGGEIVAAQLRAVGLDIEISNLEWAQWLEQVFRGHDFDLSGEIIAIGGGSLVHIADIEHRFGGQQLQPPKTTPFIVGNVDLAGRLTFAQLFQAAFDQRQGGRRFLVIAAHLLGQRIDPFFKAFQVSQHQFRLDGFSIAHRVNTTFNVCYVIVLETPQHMDNGIHLADIGKKLVAKSFPF